MKYFISMVKLALVVGFLFIIYLFIKSPTSTPRGPVTAVGTSAPIDQSPLTVESVRSNRNLWPKEVAISVPHQVPIVINGKLSGSMQVKGGRVYPLKSVDANGVSVDVMGKLMTFPVANTDLLARATEKGAGLKTASTIPPTSTLPPTSASAARPAQPANPAQPVNIMAQRLHNTLVTPSQGTFKPFDSKALATKKYTAIYFSASWCGPCREFTPQLVSWYKQNRNLLDKFDIIFVSSDKSEDKMLAYMTGDGMPWPAVKFDRKSTTPLRKYAGDGIPCLVLLDHTGKVLSDSYEGREYVGPSKVLRDLDILLKKG